jgi:hypothetical protein
MDINSVDLNYLRGPLEKSLYLYEVVAGIKFHDFADFSLTPEKPNSARTVIPVSYEGVKVGELYAIVFAKGDGTGDSKTFGLESLTIPSEYMHDTKPERVIPRSKKRVIREGFFPLFSITPQGNTAMYAASLDELSLVGNSVAKVWTLGLNNSDYSKVLDGKVIISPHVYSTVGAQNGKRVGDPHAIYYDRSKPDALQVAGFLSITVLNKELLSIAKYWPIPKK